MKLLEFVNNMLPAWLKSKPAPLLVVVKENSAKSEVSTPWLDKAKEYIGVKELPGEKHNSNILKFHKATQDQHETDEVAWCSAFVNFIMQECGYEKSNRANARSWQMIGTHLDKPQHGCIVILWRGHPTSWQGHVGFYVGEEQQFIRVLGGNQSNQVNYALYPKTQVICYRWPRKKD